MGKVAEVQGPPGRSTRPDLALADEWPSSDAFLDVDSDELQRRFRRAVKERRRDEATQLRRVLAEREFDELEPRMRRLMRVLENGPLAMRSAVELFAPDLMKVVALPPAHGSALTAPGRAGRRDAGSGARERDAAAYATAVIGERRVESTREASALTALRKAGRGR